jgi:hypothetical protein
MAKKTRAPYLPCHWNLCGHTFVSELGMEVWQTAQADHCSGFVPPWVSMNSELPWPLEVE